MKISVVVPAYNEEERLDATLRAIRKWNDGAELIVVDDGSQDRTAEIAAELADVVIRNKQNGGKGFSLWNGFKQASGGVILFLDADLGDSAVNAGDLVVPIQENGVHMTIACLPRALKRGGFGLVLGLARYGIERLSGFKCNAPLSGQRAIRREVLESMNGLSDGFGIEVGLTIDAVLKGFKVVEVPVSFRHRETGRDLRGFVHRGKEFYWVGRTLLQKWKALT
jgi:glycosyltransferase involved in cell wall biosynthesis